MERGRAIIPSNKRHVELEPMIIGRLFKVSVGVLLVPCYSYRVDVDVEVIPRCEIVDLFVVQLRNMELRELRASSLLLSLFGVY